MDIEDATIDFNCPDCGFINSTTIGDTVQGGSVICVGCLKTINFVDEDGSTKRAINEIEDAFNDLGKAFL